MLTIVVWLSSFTFHKRRAQRGFVPGHARAEVRVLGARHEVRHYVLVVDSNDGPVCKRAMRIQLTGQDLPKRPLWRQGPSKFATGC
jgi:hypothetical protein